MIVGEDHETRTLTAPDAYAELAKIVLVAQPLGAVLARVAELARGLIPDAAEVSLTLVERDRPRSVAFTGPLAVALDERQYESGRGPCLDAAVSGSVITVEDTSHDESYPEFARQAARAGIRSSLSIGLAGIVGGAVGALNVYGSMSPFDRESRDVALAFATYATVAVTNAAVFAGAVDEAAQLRTAMASRAVIEQAKGILMGHHRCTAEGAFTILRTRSNQENRKLRDVAQQIVDQASD